jgi:hypothetical protein
MTANTIATGSAGDYVIGGYFFIMGGSASL